MAAAYNPERISAGIIDVFHGDNGDEPIAWGDVARSNPWLKAAIAKATQGTDFRDPQWAHNQAGITAAGLMLGAYHFCTGDDPDAQAAHFLATVGDMTGVLLALDWEPNTRGTTATADDVTAIVLKLREAGRSPLLYCGRSMPGLPSPVLATCPLWLPEYGNTPICPPGWHTWRLHQYTDKGIVTGISGTVDLSLHDDTQGSLASLWQQMAAPSPAVPVQPPVSPAAPDDVRGLIKQLQAATGATPDGIFGPETIAKVEAWQDAH